MKTLDIVYIHQNAKGPFVYDHIPEFAEISVRQTRKFHKGRITFLCEHPEPWFSKYDVVWQDLRGFDYERGLSLTRSFRPDEGFFWQMTMCRMYVLDYYVRKSDHDYVMFLEYDNMIYQPTTLLSPYMNQDVRYCPVSSFESSPGIMIFPVGEPSLQFFRSFELVCRKTSGRLTDMTVLSALKTQERSLPLFGYPLEELPLVFDGASYGQHLGGTNNGHGKGFIDPNHYVGMALEQGMIRLNDDLPPKIIGVDGSETPIFNLHVHSKQLEKFEI